MDGSGTLFGTLAGNTREVLHRLTVDLPKKHGRGGQSALRFARYVASFAAAVARIDVPSLRMEKRHNYVRKVAEMAVQFFITNDKVRGTAAPFWTDLVCSRAASPMSAG